MKRMRIFLLAVILLFNLGGCESTGPEHVDYAFTYNGTKITLGAEAAPIIDALGKPRSYTEQPSCAFDGMDKTYYYGSFYLSTCPMNGKDYVYSIWFADDAVATQEGIRIGSTKAQVEALWGSGCFGEADTVSTVNGNTKVTVIVSDGYVASIVMELLAEE